MAMALLVQSRLRSAPAAEAGRVYSMSGVLTLQSVEPASAPGQPPTVPLVKPRSRTMTTNSVENGIEYFMGETGSSFTAMPGLDATNKVTWTMDPDYLGTYEVQTSPDLASWTNEFTFDSASRFFHAPPMAKTTDQNRVVVKVFLYGIQPYIWWRFSISREVTFIPLSDAIQAAMAWANKHPHEFRHGKGKRLVDVIGPIGLQDQVLGDFQDEAVLTVGGLHRQTQTADPHPLPLRLRRRVDPRDRL